MPAAMAWSSRLAPTEMILCTQACQSLQRLGVHEIYEQARVYAAAAGVIRASAVLRLSMEQGCAQASPGTVIS